jgi:hypothetical protein
MPFTDTHTSTFIRVSFHRCLCETRWKIVSGNDKRKHLIALALSRLLRRRRCTLEPNCNAARVSAYRECESDTWIITTARQVREPKHSRRIAPNLEWLLFREYERKLSINQRLEFSVDCKDDKDYCTEE